MSGEYMFFFIRTCGIASVLALSFNAQVAFSGFPVGNFFMHKELTSVFYNQDGSFWGVRELLEGNGARTSIIELYNADGSRITTFNDGNGLRIPTALTVGHTPQDELILIGGSNRFWRSPSLVVGKLNREGQFIAIAPLALNSKVEYAANGKVFVDGLGRITFATIVYQEEPFLPVKIIVRRILADGTADPKFKNIDLPFHNVNYTTAPDITNLTANGRGQLLLFVEFNMPTSVMINLKGLKKVATTKAKVLPVVIKEDGRYERLLEALIEIKHDTFFGNENSAPLLLSDGHRAIGLKDFIGRNKAGGFSHSFCLECVNFTKQQRGRFFTDDEDGNDHHFGGNLDVPPQSHLSHLTHNHQGNLVAWWNIYKPDSTRDPKHMLNQLGYAEFTENGVFVVRPKVMPLDIPQNFTWIATDVYGPQIDPECRTAFYRVEE